MSNLKSPRRHRRSAFEIAQDEAIAEANRRLPIGTRVRYVGKVRGYPQGREGIIDWYRTTMQGEQPVVLFDGAFPMFCRRHELEEVK